MENVPRRRALVVAAFAGVMVAEAVDEEIPDWLGARDKQRLPQRDPNILHDQIPASEVGEIEVRGLIN